MGESANFLSELKQRLRDERRCAREVRAYVYKGQQLRCFSPRERTELNYIYHTLAADAARRMLLLEEMIQECEGHE